MKHILLLGALFLFGATASAQSCTGAAGKKAKTECTKSKSSCCSAKAASCTDSKAKKGKAKKTRGKERTKDQMALMPTMQKADKKSKMSPAKN